jgi:hypothetical protein
MDYDIDYSVTSGMSFLDKQRFLNEIALQEDFLLTDYKRHQDTIKFPEGYWDPYMSSKSIKNILSFKTQDAVRRKHERHD